MKSCGSRLDSHPSFTHTYRELIEKGTLRKKQRFPQITPLQHIFSISASRLALINDSLFLSQMFLTVKHLAKVSWTISTVLWLLNCRNLKCQGASSYQSSAVWTATLSLSQTVYCHFIQITEKHKICTLKNFYGRQLHKNKTKWFGLKL